MFSPEAKEKDPLDVETGHSSGGSNQFGPWVFEDIGYVTCVYLEMTIW